MTVEFRPFRAETDRESAYRVWLEVGWADPGDQSEAQLEAFLESSSTLVAAVDDEVECIVQWCPGTIEYTGSQLSLAVITAVTTSWVGRKQGFASRLTADALTNAVEAGAEVATLGMFEQGYYDRLGFGTCGYEDLITFDPRNLKVDRPHRVPERLTLENCEEMHAALVGRMASHGKVVLSPPELLRAELAIFAKPFFALGYRTGGRLTHFLAGSAKGEHGPYKIRFIAYESAEQLLELLAMLHGLADQVASVWMLEPPHVQFQDLLDQPGRQRMLGEQIAPYPHHEAVAWQQVRILDLESCVSKRVWPGAEVAFNLSLDDQVADLLDGSWRGIGGEYTVRIGAPSSVESGFTDGLPHLNATASSFSRLWLGVARASSLAITDDLAGPGELLAALDEALCLPLPRPGWDF